MKFPVIRSGSGPGKLKFWKKFWMSFFQDLPIRVKLGKISRDAESVTESDISSFQFQQLNLIHF